MRVSVWLGAIPHVTHPRVTAGGLPLGLCIRLLSLSQAALDHHKDQKHVDFVLDEFMSYVREAKLLSHQDGEETLGVSVQMWTLVCPLHRLAFRPPPTPQGPWQCPF